MRTINESKIEIISEALKDYFVDKGCVPTQRELAKITGISKSGIDKYLKVMQGKGLIEGCGREIKTSDTKLMSVPILYNLVDPNSIWDKSNIKDHVFVSQKVFGEGKFVIITINDVVMEEANIIKGDSIVVRIQKNAEHGEKIVAIVDGRYLLVHYLFDEKTGVAVVKQKLNDEKVINQFEIRAKIVKIFKNA